MKMPKHLSAKYYQENEERMQKNLVKNINLSYKENKKRQQYDREHYKNFSEDEKQKLVEYRKRYNRMRESALL